MRRNPKWWIKRLLTNPIAAAERAWVNRSVLSHDQTMLFSIIPTIIHNIPATNKRILLETPGFSLSILLFLEIGFMSIQRAHKIHLYTLSLLVSMNENDGASPTLLLSFNFFTFRYVLQQAAVVDDVEGEIG